MPQFSKIWNTDKHDRTFIGVLLGAHLVFFLLACRFGRIYMGDSFEYIYEAFNIKDLGISYSGNPVLPIDPAHLTQRQPLYPLFLLAVYTIVVNNWVVIGLQCLLSVFNIWLVRRLLLCLGFSKKYDGWLLMLMLTYPAQMINACTIAPDILLQTFTVLYAYAAIRFTFTPATKYVVLMSIALIAGFMVKPVLFPFVFIHLVWVIWAAYKKGVKVQRPLVIALVPLCAALLYANINSSRTGKYHFSSNTAFNALFYNYKYIGATSGEDSATRFLHSERARLDQIMPYSAQYDASVSGGLTLLKQHLLGYTAYHLRKSAFIFVDPGKAETDLFTGKLTYGQLYSRTPTGFWETVKNKGISGLIAYCGQNPSILWAALVFFFNVLRVWGFVLFLRLRQYTPLLRWFMAGYCLYFALLAGPIENTRYFLPVSLLFAGCSVLGWIHRAEKRQLKNVIG